VPANAEHGGIAAGETLTVHWPTGLYALMAFLQPDVDTPCPLAEREQQIAELEGEIDQLQRTEEAILEELDRGHSGLGLQRIDLRDLVML
jgi:hypothetical protein